MQHVAVLFADQRCTFCQFFIGDEGVDCVRREARLWIENSEQSADSSILHRVSIQLLFTVGCENELWHASRDRFRSQACSTKVDGKA